MSENSALHEKSVQERAEDWYARAGSQARKGDISCAVASLRHAVSVLAADQTGDPDMIRRRAEYCDLLGNMLVDAGMLPEAMQAYQESVDAYGRVPDLENQARAVSLKIVAGVQQLRKHPYDRLYLLIARHERRCGNWQKRPAPKPLEPTAPSG